MGNCRVDGGHGTWRCISCKQDWTPELPPLEQLVGWLADDFAFMDKETKYAHRRVLEQMTVLGLVRCHGPRIWSINGRYYGRD